MDDFRKGQRLAQPDAEYWVNRGHKERSGPYPSRDLRQRSYYKRSARRNGRRLCQRLTLFEIEETLRNHWHPLCGFDNTVYFGDIQDHEEDEINEYWNRQYEELMEMEYDRRQERRDEDEITADAQERFYSYHETGYDSLAYMGWED